MTFKNWTFKKKKKTQSYGNVILDDKNDQKSYTNKEYSMKKKERWVVYI